MNLNDWCCKISIHKQGFLLRFTNLSIKMLWSIELLGNISNTYHKISTLYIFTIKSKIFIVFVKKIVCILYVSIAMLYIDTIINLLKKKIFWNFSKKVFRIDHYKIEWCISFSVIIVTKSSSYVLSIPLIFLLLWIYALVAPFFSFSLSSSRRDPAIRPGQQWHEIDRWNWRVSLLTVDEHAD